MAAIYQADIWCDDCADTIRERIWLESEYGPTYNNRKEWEEAFEFDDRSEYDSDEYPEYCDDDEACDYPQHCAAGAMCINAEVLAGGGKVGYFFGNSLTSDGAAYVKTTVREDTEAGFDESVACTIWKPHYDWIDYETTENPA
jgi:hypothetical protein